MTNPLDERPRVTSFNLDGRPDDVLIHYSTSNLVGGDVDDWSSMFNSSRRIEVIIMKERDDEIEAHLEVTDNTVKGKYAMIGTSENLPPEDEYEEFTERVVYQKSEVPYYQDDFPKPKSYVPIGERIAPNVKDWSQDEPFRA